MPGKKRAAAAAVDEEEAFPRGGGAGLAPIEVKQLRKEAYDEAEAELLGHGKRGGKRQKHGAAGADWEAGDEEDAFFSTLSIQGQLPKYAELLRFKSLSVGAKLWGAVIEVGQRELVVSLPHGLRGHVAYNQASDWLGEQWKKAQTAAGAAAGEGAAVGGGRGAGGKGKKAGAAAAPTPLSDLFSIGQLVRCVVIALDDGTSEQPASGAASKKGCKTGQAAAGGARKKKKLIHLSLKAAAVNAGLGPEAVKDGLALPACVHSVEDHGYLLTLGIKGCPSAFLPRQAAPAAGPPLQPGSLVEVVVTQAPKPRSSGGAVVVSGEREAVAGAVAREWEGLNIGSLLPGALVTARVRHLLSDGLLASFLTYFTATVDPLHLGWAGADWKKHFSPQQRLKARILYVDPASKRVGLTLLPHLLAMSLPENFPLLGQVFEDARVLRLDPGLGLLCTLPALAPDAPPLAHGFAHISNVDDERVELDKRFRLGQRARCRVIGFRPMDGLAVLSLRPSVVEQHILSITDLRPGMPVAATVDRAEDFGLLCHVTSTIRAVVPQAHISDVPSKKALRKFKEGQKVSARVLSVDEARKRVTLTLKPSLLGSKLPLITCLEDAVPGGRSHGVVTGVQDFGVFVAFYGGVTGLAHISECGLPPGQKPGQAYEAGHVVKCRVLGVDAGKKGLKLSLVSKRKAPTAAEEAAAAAPAADAPAEPAAAEEGEQQQGAAAAREAAAGGQAVEGADSLGGYHPGDVVFGVVTAVHMRGAEAEDDEGEPPAPAYYELSVPASPAGDPSAPPSPQHPVVAGRLDVAHLADHPAAVAALRDVVAVGSRLGPLLVLQRLERAKQLRLSRKASLLAASEAGRLPFEFESVAEGMAVQGYVASVTPDAVFVRFLGGLTARAGLAQLSDTFVSDPRLHFSEGQSVRAHVAQVDTIRQRFSLTLKQSLCAGDSGAEAAAAGTEYLQSLLVDVAVVEQLAAAEGSEVDWEGLFGIGTVVEGSVHDVKEYGLLCDLQPHPDVVGLAAPHQVPGGADTPAVGAPISAVVLDFNRKDGIVDLSIQPALVEQARAVAAAATAAAADTGGKAGKKAKKQKRSEGQAQVAGKEQAGQAQGPGALAVGQRVNCRVQLVKEQEGYSVVTLEGTADGNAGGATAGPPALQLGLLPTTDFNLRQQQLQHRFVPGDVIIASVAVLPSPATGGRLLLHVPLTAAALKAAAQTATNRGAAGGNGARGREQAKHVIPGPATVCGAKVTAVHPLHADLALDGGCRGRLHITQVADLPTTSSSNQPGTGSSSGASPLAALREGQQLPAVAVLGKLQTAEGRRHGLVECSLRPSVLDALAKNPDALPKQLSWPNIKAGQELQGYVQEVEGGYVWCAFSPIIRGRAFLAEAAPSLEACRDPAAAFHPGQAVKARVLRVDSTKHALDMALGSSTPAEPRVGSTLLGRVAAVAGTGVMVQLSARSRGKVPLSSIHDRPVANALAGLEAGQYVRVAVVGPADAKGAYTLSLKPSQGGVCTAHVTAELAPSSTAAAPAAAPSSAAQLAAGHVVGGYIKAATPAGVFVCLAPGVEARIRLSQLADGFVEQPAAAFPEGQHVEARVASVDGDKVELTLRTNRDPAASLAALEEGQVVRGRVKRVEKFGVFVELGAPHAGVTGLAHVSQLADDFVKDVASLFTLGQSVVARVLQVDAAAGRLSLGLKPSYMEGLSDEEGSGGGEGLEGEEEEADFDDELAGASSSSDEEEEGEEPDGDGDRVAEMEVEGGGGSSSEEELADLDEELAEADATQGTSSSDDA